MRNDPSTRPQLFEKFGPQLNIDALEQIHGNHRGLADVGLEEVIFYKIDQVLDARIRGKLHGVGNTQGVYLDAHALRAELPSGLNEDAAFARTEVVEDIARPYFTQLKHGTNNVFIGGYEGNVEEGIGFN